MYQQLLNSEIYEGQLGVTMISDINFSFLKKIKNFVVLLFEKIYKIKKWN